MKKQFVRNKIVLAVMLVLLCSVQVVGQDVKWHKDSRTGLYGVIYSETGEWYLPPKYTSVQCVTTTEGVTYTIDGCEMVDEYREVAINKKWGLFNNKTWKEVIPCIYFHLGQFHEGLAAFQKENKVGAKWGYIDTNGKEVLPEMYDKVGDFKSGRAKIEFDGFVGFIDKTGRFLLKPAFWSIEGFNKDGYARVTAGDSNGEKVWGFIDSTLKIVIPCTNYFEGYTDTDQYGDRVNRIRYRDFHQGLIVVNKEDGKFGLKFGVMDKTGKEIVPIKYTSVTDFSSDGYAIVELNGVKNYVDETGKIVDKKIVEDARAKVATENAAIAEKERQKRAIQAEKEEQELIKNTKHLLGTWKGRASVSGNYMDLTVEIKDHESASLYVKLSNGQSDSDNTTYTYISPTEISINYQGKNSCKIKGNTMVMTMGSSSKLDITLTKQSKSAKKKSKK